MTGSRRESIIIAAMAAGVLALWVIGAKFAPDPPAQTCADQMREAVAKRPPPADLSDLLWKRCRHGD